MKSNNIKSKLSGKSTPETYFCVRALNGQYEVKMNEFEKLGINTDIVESITKQGITTPTEIQKESIPLILKGEDVIGKSYTGSGKTLAFGVGILQKVNPKDGIQAVVLTPTRELAEQVKKSIKELSNGLKVTAIYGGVAFNPQVANLERAEIIVSTPGRLLDHIGQETIDLTNVKIVVLDEADRMLEMGFIEDVEEIIKNCPKERQTLFFSATISERIRELSDQFMKNKKTVTAKEQVDPSKLKQVYYEVSKNLKLKYLVNLIKKDKSDKVMVFANTRQMVDRIGDVLIANKINSRAIHGGLSQSRRLQNIDAFNEGNTAVLVCTDVAARGLHINKVTHIYNYDIPKEAKEYVHRIGRTARAGESGKVINLLCDFDYDNFSRILQDYRDMSIDLVTFEEKLEEIKSSRRNDRPNNFRGRSDGKMSGNNFRSGNRENSSRNRDYPGMARADGSNGSRGKERTFTKRRF